MTIEEYKLHGSDANLAGIHIALVVDNQDPKCCERVKVRVIGIHDMQNDVPENSIWAQHMAPSKGTSGEVPRAGDFVYVMFRDIQDPMSCLWMGYVRTIS